MKNFWNNRYDTSTYVYGKEANAFLSQHLVDYTPGKILLPADGEGRNSVWAAQQGWQTTAFDYSSTAQKKAQELAQQRNVQIDYQVESLENFTYPKNHYDALAFIFVHIHENEYESLFSNLCQSLKPGGLFLFQCYSKQQLGRHSGGPQKLELLYDTKSLMNLNAFEIMSFKLFEEVETKLNEGPYHQGLASVIQFLAIKKPLP